MSDPSSDPSSNPVPQTSSPAATAPADPDAEAARLLGLGPRLKEFLQGLDLDKASPSQGLDLDQRLPTPADAPPRLGRYLVLRLIGEGGMGRVYEAEQDHPRRRVALKVIKPGMDSRQVTARFEAEREALALMDHPNIARVFDAGVTDTGRSYFAMELVDGVPVTDYCDAHRLTVRQRLELFIPVCRAVQHAHQKGMIHRDLKPSNVLVTTVDAMALPKVIDFGVAKALHQRPADQTALTEVQQLVGTPEYMSPEQAGARGGDVDTRSDVYSLGVVLYELLTGTTPFGGSRLRSLGHEEARRIVREVEPPRPSTRLNPSTGDATSGKCAASARGTDPAALHRTVRGELDWIVMKCLEKDRSRRYETVNELAADLERHLRNEPVHAGPPTASYRLKKFARRNRTVLIAAGAMCALFVGGIAGTAVGLIRARAAQTAALNQAKTAGAATTFLDGILSSARYDFEAVGGPDARVVDLIDWAAAEMGEKLRGQPELEFRARCTLHYTYWNLGLQAEMERNLLRAHDLMVQTGSQHTESGMQVRISMIELMNGRDQETESQALAAEARKLFGGQEVSVRATCLHSAALGRAGRFAAAEAVLRPLVEECRVHPMGPSPFQHLADVLWAQGKPDDAEALYREAVSEIDRYHGSARHDLIVSIGFGELLSDRDKRTQALDVYRKALARFRPRLGDAHPAVAIAYLYYVGLLRDLGQDGEAAQARQEWTAALASLVERPAKTCGSLEQRAYANLFLGRLDQAAADYARCAELEPTRHQAWFIRACILAFTDQTDQHEEYNRVCREMIRRFPQPPDREIANRTARVFLAVPRSAAECAIIEPFVEQALEQNWQDVPWAVTLKGLAEFRAGRFDDAAEWLEKARRLETTRPRKGRWPALFAVTELLLAMSNHRLGRPDEAQAAFDRACRIIEAEVAAPDSGETSTPVFENRLICHTILREARAVLPAAMTAARPTEAAR
jgi:non-specific serine/threonine protein kinase/serine/threonine-protein kinase